jgi:signal transduction histidine kinase
VLDRRGISYELDAAIGVEADRELLARVVENLVDNGMRHTPQGGRMRVWASAVDGAIELRIGNSGAAIPEASRPLVFEKYTQVWDARGGGSVGLGLYFCRLAVEAHGGAIWIEETGELATVFAIRLPVPAVPRPHRLGVH